MSSTNSIESARSAELAKEKAIWEYSTLSESIVDASSSCQRVRGCEDASSSSSDGASPSLREVTNFAARECRSRGNSPLADLFSYPSTNPRRSRELGEATSSKRVPRTGMQEGVGTSRPSTNVEASATDDRRMVIEIPHLRDESLSPAEPPFEVKLEECIWAYNPLEEAERVEAWIASGLAEVAQKKKRTRRKQRPPPGSSWCTEESLDTLREECHIPDAVELIAPTVEQREDDPPVGTFTAYECWFRGCYLTLPIQATILRFMWVHRIALAQINTRGVRQLVGLLTRAAECGEPIGVRQLRNFLEFRTNKDPGGKKLYNLASRPLYKIIDDFPNKDHSWRKFFFFVPISPESVELEHPAVAKWGTLARRPLGTPAPGIDDLFTKLKERKCLWERHFYLRRVIRARKLALNAEEDSIHQSDSDDLAVMPQQPSFRDIVKKQAEKEKRRAEKAARKDKAKAIVVEVSDRSVAKGDTPAATSGDAAVADASGGLAVITSQPITISDHLAEPENQLSRKRRHSASEKGKGKTGEPKRTRRELPTLPQGEPIPPGPRPGKSAELYDDPLAAAALMAKVTYPGDNMPIPELLLKSELYREFASRQAKTIAHCNRMIVAYDQEARSRQAFINEAREKEEAEKTRAAVEMNSLIAERDMYKRESDDLMKNLHTVNLGKKKVEDEKAELEAEVLALRASREREIEEAVSSARRTAAAEVRTHLTRANELFCKMMKRPIRNMVYLSQAESNLQLLDDIEKVDAAEPFDPKAERALLVENKAKLGDAHGIFDEIALELRKTLGKNYVVPINVSDVVVSPRIEISAKSIGIDVASGSNDGSLGMRLRGASEELSDSASSESGKSQEAEPLREPTPIAPTGEVAGSSSIAAPPAEEKEREEGEEEEEEGELVAEKDGEDGEPVA